MKQNAISLKYKVVKKSSQNEHYFTRLENVGVNEDLSEVVTSPRTRIIKRPFFICRTIHNY